MLVELKQWFGDLTLNVILRMVAGKRYSVATDDEEKKEARQVQKALREFFYFVGLFLVGDVIPYLRWLDLGGHEKAMKKTGKELDAIVGKWVEEHKRKRALEGYCEGKQDFIDAMHSMLEGADLGGLDADTINKAIDDAVAEANAQGIHGKATTPFLLAKIKDLTGGDSLDSNIQLVYNNARLAAKTAIALSELEP